MGYVEIEVLGGCKIGVEYGIQKAEPGNGIQEGLDWFELVSVPSRRAFNAKLAGILKARGEDLEGKIWKAIKEKAE